MAKKAISKLQKGGGKGYTKVIRMIRSKKTGAYAFQEKIVPAFQVHLLFT